MSTPPQQTTPPAPRPVVGMYSFRSIDPPRLAAFWADLMQLPTAPGAGPELVMLDLDHEVGPVTWIFERAEAADGGGAPVALDISTPDGSAWAEVADRAEALGARRLADRSEAGVRWVEMADPDGNRFRVFAPRPV